MPWQGIWFDHQAREGGARSPEWFQGFDPPVVYPFVHSFVEAEEARLRKSRDPGVIFRDGKPFSAYYSITHDSGENGLDQQGCRIFRWLFENFQPGSPGGERAVQ